jgi:hypothetical protein
MIKTDIFNCMTDIETKQYQLDENRKYNRDDEPVKRNTVSREFLGYIPVMLRSNCCRLKVRKGKGDGRRRKREGGG